MWGQQSVCGDVLPTSEVVLLGDGQREQADVAQRRGPVVGAQADQAQLGGALGVGEGQHHDQQEAHHHHKLQRTQLRYGPPPLRAAPA